MTKRFGNLQAFWKFVAIAALTLLFLGWLSSYLFIQGKDKDFEIAIMDDSVELEASYDSAFQVLQGNYPEKVIYRLTTRDIKSYDWERQEITLTTEASRALIDLYGCSGDFTTTCLVGKNFLVLYNQQPVYGGLFFFTGPARYIDYPLILVSNSTRPEDRFVSGQDPSKMESAIVFHIVSNSWKIYSGADLGVVNDERIRMHFEK